MLCELEREDRMAAALEIRRDLFSPVELRSRARRERSPRTATRILAIANALEGLSREPRPHGWPGWNARRSETRWSATISKALRACPTAPNRAARPL